MGLMYYLYTCVMSSLESPMEVLKNTRWTLRRNLVLLFMLFFVFTECHPSVDGDSMGSLCIAVRIWDFSQIDEGFGRVFLGSRGGDGRYPFLS